MGNFQNSALKGFIYCDTDQCVEFKFREIWSMGNW